MIVTEPENAEAAGEIEDRAAVGKVQRQALRAGDIHVLEAEDVVDLQQVLVEVLRIERHRLLVREGEAVFQRQELAVDEPIAPRFDFRH